MNADKSSDQISNLIPCCISQHGHFIKAFTVNSEIFARILFLLAVLRGIIATLKICKKDVIYYFHENFVFTSNVKSHICDFENLGQRRDLPILVNETVTLLIREDFIFMKLRKNKILLKVSEFTVSKSLSVGPYACLH